MIVIRPLILFTILALPLVSFAQKKQPKEKEVKKLIQFSGIVVSGTKDSLLPLPFVNIVIKHTNKGCISDFGGFFTLAVQPHDTIEFSAIGFKKARVLIPDTIKSGKYSEMRVLTGDTVMLRAAIIRAWPPLEQFKEVFLATKVPDNDLDRARKNLERAAVQMRFQIVQDGGVNYTSQVQQRADQIYYAGQLIPNRLLDPIAWSKLIQAWKNGELKVKTDEVPVEK